MPTICLDIKEDKRFTTTSPISIGVWLAIFLVINVLVPLSILYFIFSFMSFALVHLFFQFEARLIFLTIRFLQTQVTLTPHFEDKAYISDIVKFKSVERAVHPRFFKAEKERLERVKAFEEAHKAYLQKIEKEIEEDRKKGEQ